MYHAYITVSIDLIVYVTLAKFRPKEFIIKPRNVYAHIVCNNQTRPGVEIYLRRIANTAAKTLNERKSGGKTRCGYNSHKGVLGYCAGGWCA